MCELNFASTAQWIERAEKAEAAIASVAPTLLSHIVARHDNTVLPKVCDASTLLTLVQILQSHYESAERSTDAGLKAKLAESLSVEEVRRAMMLWVDVVPKTPEAQVALIEQVRLERKS